MPETPDDLAKDPVMPGSAGNAVGSSASYDTLGRIADLEAHVRRLETRLEAIEAIMPAPDEDGGEGGSAKHG